MTIDIDVDYDKVNEILRRKKNKKNRSSKVQLSEKTPGESSARTRGIENLLVASIITSTMPKHDDVSPSHLAMLDTSAHDGVVTHD